MSGNNDYWFPAKRFGFGWGAPRRWQGWVVLAVYVLVVTGAGLYFPPDSQMSPFLLVVGIATVLLLLVCMLKGESPFRRSKH